MIVRECVPSRLAEDLTADFRVDHDLISIRLYHEASAIFLPHFLRSLLDVFLPLVFHFIHEALTVRRVANALKEFDPFFSLDVLQLAILLDERLLVDR